MNAWTIARGLIIGSAGVWFAVATFYASDAIPVGFAGVMILFLLGFPVGGAWIVYSIAWPGVFRSWSRALTWMMVPGAPFVAAVGAETGWPMAVRVRMNEDALREFAESVRFQSQEELERNSQPARVGSFDLHSIWNGNGIVGLTTQYDMFDSGGILYSPDGPPSMEDRPRQYVTHLYGPWYRFHIPD